MHSGLGGPLSSGLDVQCRSTVVAVHPYWEGLLGTFHTHSPSVQVVGSVEPSDMSLLIHCVRDCAILHKQKSSTVIQSLILSRFG